MHRQPPVAKLQPQQSTVGRDLLINTVQEVSTYLQTSLHSEAAAVPDALPFAEFPRVMQSVSPPGGKLDWCNSEAQVGLKSLSTSVFLSFGRVMGRGSSPTHAH